MNPERVSAAAAALENAATGGTQIDPSQQDTPPETPAESELGAAFTRAFGEGDTDHANLEAPDPTVLEEPAATVPISEPAAPTSLDMSAPERSLSTAYNFTPTNEGLFHRLSNGAKNTMNGLYEGLYKIPGANKLLAKWELARGEKLIDKNQEKLVRIKEQIEAIDQEVLAKDAGKAQLEQTIATMEQQGLPGIDQIRLKLGEIEDQKRNLLNAREDNQKNFEKRDKKGKIFAEHREGVANRFIEEFDKKLEPLNEQYAEYKERQDQLEGDGIRLKIFNKNAVKENDAYKETLESLKSAYLTAGYPESKISKLPGFAEINQKIAENTKKIESSKALHEAAVLQHKAKMDALQARIAKYENKKKPFTRAKEKQPIDIPSPSSAPEHSDTGRFMRNPLEGIYTESPTRKKIESFINAWNEYVEEQNGDIEENRKIDPEQFYRTRAYNKDTWLDFDDFKQVYMYHLRMENISHDETALSGTLERFLHEKLEQA